MSMLMYLWGRLVHWLQAQMQGLLAPAEDPRQAFVYIYDRQQELLAKVQQAQVQVATVKSQLESRTAEVRVNLPQLEEQARLALAAGREDMARLALQRRHVAVLQLQSLEEQVRVVQQEEQRLSLVEQRLATQIEAFHARQEVTAARYNAASAQVRIAEALSGISRELADVDLSLKQAEQKAESMQARAWALDQLAQAGGLEMAAGLEMPGPLAGKAVPRPGDEKSNETMP